MQSFQTKIRLLNQEDQIEVYDAVFFEDSQGGHIKLVRKIATVPKAFVEAKSEEKEADKVLEESGVSVDRSGDRTTIKVDPGASSLFSFFSKHSPCDFEGCEELRKEYFEEAKTVGSCCTGGLIRKYLAIVRERKNSIQKG